MEKKELEKELMRIDEDIGDSIHTIREHECNLREILFQKTTWESDLEKLRKDTINSVIEGPVSINDGMNILKETVKLENDWEDGITTMCKCSLSEKAK